MALHWFSREDLLPEVRGRMLETSIVLDVGCGIRPQDHFVPAVHICCEPFSQYVDHLQRAIGAGTERRFRDRRYVLLQASWRESLASFAAHSVDTVFALDFIEHLPKDEGREFLIEAERVARTQIVLFTPLGYVPQERLHGGKDAWGYDGAEWQEHRSGWEPDDFDASWDVYGAREFHLTNNIGQALTEPTGALYAIKTLARGAPQASVPRLRQRVGEMLQRVGEWVVLSEGGGIDQWRSAPRLLSSARRRPRSGSVGR